jgi:5-methyltetrahydrofolate--homocysteine methyltransferase
MTQLIELAQLLYDGDAEGVARTVRRCLDDGMEPQTILNRGLLPGMERVGREFQAGELFIPEIIVAARAMHAGIDLVEPLLAAGGAGLRSRGTVALGTVKGDLHDIGKKLVAIMLLGGGFQVVDLGHDVPPERFAEAVREEGCELVGLSALLSTTMPMMKTTIDHLGGEGLKERVKVMVGGAPVTQQWADEIGADGYAPDAVAAVEKARQLLQERGAKDA